MIFVMKHPLHTRPDKQYEYYHSQRFKEDLPEHIHL